MRMPYPEETVGTTSPTQPEETISKTEKHWNQVILAFLAIGTTVLGATLVVYGRSDWKCCWTALEASDLLTQNQGDCNVALASCRSERDEESGPLRRDPSPW